MTEQPYISTLSQYVANQTKMKFDMKLAKVISAVFDTGSTSTYQDDPTHRRKDYILHLEEARENFDNKLPSAMTDAIPELKIEPETIKKMFIENIKPLAGSGWPEALMETFQSPDHTPEALYKFYKTSYAATPLLCELSDRTVENARKLMSMDTEARKAKILSLKELMDRHAMTSNLHPESSHDSVDTLWDRAFGEKQDSLALCQLCLGAAVAEVYKGALDGYKEFIGSSTNSSEDTPPKTVGAFWANTLAVKNSKWNHIHLHA